MFRDLRGLLALALLITALVVVGFLALGVGAMTVSALIATQAKAECDIFHCEPRRKVRRRTYHRRTPEREVRYYAPPYRMDYEGCGPGPVRGLGTQWIGKEGALEAAKKDWMERVRFDLGEKYLDLSNAKDFEASCSRVSVGKVLDQVMYRCDVRARPCKGEMAEMEGEQ
jgi:hypothetical protein